MTNNLCVQSPKYLGLFINSIRNFSIYLLIGGLCLALTAFHANATQTQGNAADAALEQGRLYTEWFYNGELEQLLAQLVFDVSLQELVDFRQTFLNELGQEQQLLVDRVTPIENKLVYVRIAYFENAPIPIAMQWYLDNGLKVAGVIGPGPAEAPSDYLNYQTKTELRLPFNGLWYVVWGGRLIEQNYHAAISPQRFALDMLVSKKGRTFAGDGTRNEQYFCFGRPVVSPGDGVIIEMIDGVVDNQPGVLNPLEPAGNYVVIDHGNNEYSYLAHFKQGSVAVIAGQRVKTGQYLGQCGNSGNSSEPHVHYHMQNTPYLNIGDGLPVQFKNYLADGKRVKLGEPTKGQFIRSVYNQDDKDTAPCENSEQKSGYCGR